MPYYVLPYTAYPYPYPYPYDSTYDSAPPPEDQPPAEQPAYPEPENSEPPVGARTPHLYYVPPETTGSLPDQLPAPYEPPVDTSPRPKAKTVTLLAFKDKTVVAVTDYWLKGQEIHYKREDTDVGVPIEQLDFPLTQQLNQERNVPFVLESRP